MFERSERLPAKIVTVSLILAAGACLALWFVRIYCAISFRTPYMDWTTGYEWESAFSIWRLSQHLPVYSDPRHIPFTCSCFNWAYYYFYGPIIIGWLRLLHLNAIWIATIGRLISLVFTALTGGVFYFSWRDLANPGSVPRRSVMWAWILIAVAGPVVGFWSVSLRPDLAALAFESAGFYLVLRTLREPKIRFIVVAALLFYAGWAFKQSSVTMLTGSALTFLALKRWRAFFTLAGIWWLLVIATLVLGGADYRQCLLFSQSHLPMEPLQGVGNTLRAVSKNPFLVLCIPAVLWRPLGRFRGLIARPVELALALTIVFSFCFALITGCKAGANDNYFIPASWVVMLAFALRWEELKSRWVQVGIAVCSGFLIAAIALTPTGLTFLYDFRSSDVRYNAVAQRLRQLPGPAIATDPYANMPWVQPYSPHFVFGFSYYYDRAAGVPYEDDGWEGLASRGYFGTIMIDSNYNPSPTLLEKYKLVDEYRDWSSDFRFYRRIDSAGR